MLERSAFESLVDEIQSQGYDEPAAAHFAALLGDRPVKDQDGRLVVVEQGREVARLRPLLFFGDR